MKEIKHAKGATTMDTTVQLATDLMATTRREIEAYGRARGISPLHLTHQSKRILAAYVARESIRVGGGEPASQAAVEAALRGGKATKAPYRPHVKAAAGVYGTYLVESERFPGQSYRVDPLLGRCSCPATKPCKHLFIAEQVHDALLRMRYAVRMQQQRAAETAGAFPVAA